MKHIKNLDDFLSEKSKPKLSPEAALRKSEMDINKKISDLNDKMKEKPEQRNLFLAQIQVETEKLDMIRAKENLLSAKDAEENRKKKEQKIKELLKNRK